MIKVQREKRAYQTLRKNMPMPYDRMNRVENIVIKGMPDINFCSEGVECWIEMKAIIEPVRETTRAFTGHSHNLTLAQRNWMLSQKNAKGNCYILIETDKRWLLIDGLYADEINTATINRLIELSAWYREKPVYKEHWLALRAVLQGAA